MTTASTAPDTCDVGDLGYEGGHVQQCHRYYETLTCCGLYEIPTPSDGFSPGDFCVAQVDDYQSGVGPQECAGLFLAALECAVPQGEVGCTDLDAYFAGLMSDQDGTASGPPTDTDMPCYAEVMALWDAGCQPVLN